MSFRWLPLSRRAGHAHRTPSAVIGRAKIGRRRANLEFLEDRTLLSNTIPLSSTSWTSIGPEGVLNTAAFGGTQGTGGPASGEITGIAASPTDPNTIFVATNGGGVWETTDGGVNWSTTTDNQPTLNIGSIAVAPSNPQIIYAGTGSANNTADSYTGQGVLKSADGGATWTLLGNASFARKSIGKIVVDPNDPTIVYAAVSANGTYSTPGSTGIYESTDGGNTWTNTTSVISTTDTWSDLVINPTNPLNLFAAVGTSTGAAANGVYETVNGGQTWAPAGNFLMGAANGAADGRIALAISASNPLEVLASVANPGSGSASLKALELSTDGGATWTSLSGVPNFLGVKGDVSNVVAIDPSNPNVLYGAGTGDSSQLNRVIESTDAGATWNDITVDASGVQPHTTSEALAFDASGLLLDGNTGGIWQLQNPNPNNFSWSDINGNLTITQFNSVAIDPSNPNIAYGGAKAQGVSKFNDNLDWTMIAGKSGGEVAVDPTTPTTVYAEGTGSLSLMKSVNGGTTFTSITTGISQFDPIANVAPYVIDPSNSSHLLFGTNRIYTTTNGGTSWTALTTPFSNGFNDATPIVSLAIAASDPNTIYAATTDAKVFVSTDAGSTWTEHDIPTDGDAISQIVVDPANAMTAYAVRDNYNTMTNSGHVFETTNGGTTWTDISGNLPDVPAYSIAVDDANSRIFVGNATGVYASTDGGTTWAPFMTGLPNVQVNSLELSTTQNILAAGTFGRGAYEIYTSEMLSVTPDPINAVEGNPIDPNAPIAEFSDSMGLQPTTSYSATIIWGDGTSSVSTDIRVLADGNYGVFAPHTYVEEGSDMLSVVVTSNTGITGSTGSTVLVADAPLTAASNLTPIAATVGQQFSGVVGGFTDGDPLATLSDFTGNVTIDWGDGVTSAGTVAAVAGQPGSFTVSGTHTYGASEANASPTISINVTDVGGSMVTILNTADVVDAPLTPFPNTAPPQRTISETAGVSFTTTIASFTSGDSTAQASYYDVQISWGDGTNQEFLPGSGVVVFSGTHFNINATHTYVAAGSYDIITTITNEGPNGTLVGGSTVTLETTANVSPATIANASSVPIIATEGQTFSGTVATFSSSNLLSVPSDYQNSTITWGDGTTSAATITANGNGKFTVSGTHVYAEEGTDTFTVQIATNGSNGTTNVSGTATVNDAAITVTPIAQVGIAGTPITGVIATIIDSDLQAPLSDYASGAQINWGDGTFTTGAISQPGGVGTQFQVNGSHTYANGGVYTITVTVTDAGGATDTESTTATINSGVFSVSGVTTTPIPIGQSFTGTLALLNTGNPLASANEYIATINYGDGTFAQGTLTNQGGGVFTIADPAGHVFASVGSYDVQVSVIDLSGNQASGDTLVTVVDAPIVVATGSPVPIVGVAGTPISGILASFTQYAGTPATDFTAQISWGDGTSSLGTVTQEANGTFDVSGSHLYTLPGSYTPQITLTDLYNTTGTIFGDVTITDPPITGTPSPITAILGRPFIGVVATFIEPNTFATASEFQATINWGDGTPATLGVVSGSNGTFTVVGSHTFTIAAAALPVTITIDHLIGGSSTTVVDSAHVFSLLSGALNTASDSGPSNHDGVTKITAPTFSGKADPGSTVVIFASPTTNLSRHIIIGSTLANALGSWSVQVSPLLQGNYVITASMVDTTTRAVAQTIGLTTGARFGILTIDTQHPVVAAVSLSPKTGTLHITFQTGTAGMYLAALMNPANYVLDVINSNGSLTPLRATRITPVNLGNNKVEANLVYNGGKVLPNDGYVVTLHALPLIDLAGNTLVETRLVTFPQTTNSPNPDYVAQINVVSGVASAPVQYISLAEQQAATNYLNGTTGQLVVRVPRRPTKPVIVVRVG